MNCLVISLTPDEKHSHSKNKPTKTTKGGKGKETEWDMTENHILHFAALKLWTEIRLCWGNPVPITDRWYLGTFTNFSEKSHLWSIKDGFTFFAIPLIKCVVYFLSPWIWPGLATCLAQENVMKSHAINLPAGQPMLRSCAWTLTHGNQHQAWRSPGTPVDSPSQPPAR